MALGVVFPIMTVSLFTGRAIRGRSCGLLAAWALQLTAQADQIIYDDALENGWQNWSWATVPVSFYSASFKTFKHRSFSPGVPTEMRIHSGNW